MDTTDRVDIGMTEGEHRFVLVGFPLAGAGIAALLPVLWRLVDGLDWVPLRGVLETVVGWDEPWQVATRLGVGLAGGLLLALAALHDETRVAVGAQDLRVTRAGTTREIRRDQVVGAYLDGKRLVVKGTGGRTLLEAPVDNAKSVAAPAFRRFGYPWEGVD